MKSELDLFSDGLKQAILNLPYSTKMDDGGRECDMVFIPESDYGFAEIYRMYDDILVFLIPTYGGVPAFYKCYGRHSVDYLIKELREM